MKIWGNTSRRGAEGGSRSGWEASSGAKGGLDRVKGGTWLRAHRGKRPQGGLEVLGTHLASWEGAFMYTWRMSRWNEGEATAN
eukprot:scaffold8015_cov149-Isochrysis_galbana.AAC.3